MDWEEIINPLKNTDRMKQLKSFIQERRKVTTVYPESNKVFRAFNICPYDKLKLVIIGQDPYPGKNIADGLAFSTKQKAIPFSLNIIFEEIHNNLYRYIKKEERYYIFPSNDLSSWAKQGVLLINRVLTNEEGKINAHKERGWEEFTDSLINKLNDYPKPLVFMLWGNDAKSLKSIIRNENHLILEASHPAAEKHKKNAGFLGCNHFLLANNFLKDTRKDDMEKNTLVDINEFFDKENAVRKIKDVVKKTRCPFPDPKKRINDFVDFIENDFKLVYSYPINYSTNNIK